MSTRKFDFECIYYTNELIVQFDKEGIFIKNMILPEKLRYIVLQLTQTNYDANGHLGLYKEQIVGALEHAQKISYDQTIDEMVKEGLIEYSGIDNDGEYQMRLTKEGKETLQKEEDMVQLASELGLLKQPKPPEEGEPSTEQ